MIVKPSVFLLFALAAAPLFGQDATLVARDSFSENVRPSCWKTDPGNTALLCATNKRVYYASNGGRLASWIRKTPNIVQGDEILQSSAVIHTPWKDMEPDSFSYVSLGIGWRCIFPGVTNTVTVGYFKLRGTFYLMMKCYGSQSRLISYPFPMPYSLEKYNVALKYNNKSGKLFCYQAAPDWSWIARAGVFKLRGAWKIPPSTPIQMYDMIFGDSDDFPITLADSFYLDNFKTIRSTAL